MAVIVERDLSVDRELNTDTIMSRATRLRRGWKLEFALGFRSGSQGVKTAATLASSLVLVILTVVPAAAHYPGYSLDPNLYPHGRGAVVCFDTERLGGPHMDAYPQIDKATGFNGYEYDAVKVVAKNIDTGQWRVVNDYWWQHPDYNPAGDIFVNFESSLNPMPLGHWVAGFWYAWRYWTGSRWSEWKVDFSYAVMFQQGDGPHETGHLGNDPCGTSPETTLIGGGCFSLGGGCLRSLVRESVDVKNIGSQLVGDTSSPSGNVEPRAGRDAPRCFGEPATIVGTTGDDLIVGIPGRDVIVGRGGDDIILGGGGSDRICGGPGDDQLAGEAGADKIDGGAGNDAILGGPGPDFLMGGDGSDIIEPGPGNDRARAGTQSFDGAQSFDILTYQFEPRGVTVDFGQGVAIGSGRDTFDHFSAVIGTPFDDRLIGSDGDEVFVPLGGDDYVDGAAGVDTVAFLFSDASVEVNLSEERATGEGTDRLRNVENVAGSPFADIIVGSETYNLLLGLAENDFLDGKNGGDSLIGGDGIDECFNGLAYFGCENQAEQVVPPPPPSFIDPSGESPPPPE